MQRLERLEDCVLKEQGLEGEKFTYKHTYNVLTILSK